MSDEPTAAPAREALRDAPPRPPEEDGGPRMSLAEHLEELRRRLVRGLLAIAVCFAIAWWFQDETNRLVLWPLQRSVEMLNVDLAEAWHEYLVEHPEARASDYFVVEPDGTERLRAPIDSRPQATGPGEAFVANLKGALYLSLFLGGPVVLWQLWQFIAAGLYRHERRAVLAYFPTSLALFAVGTLFSYLVMVPYGIYFLNTSVDMTQVRPDFRYAQYFGFLSSMCIGLGVCFQLPVVMTALARVGLVESAVFAQWRKHFIVAAFVIGAVLTPPDPFTQSMIAVPMVLLYEIGIWSGRFAERRRPTPGAVTAEAGA